MCTLKAETGLKQREDLIEITAALVDRNQIIEFLLRGGSVDSSRKRDIGAHGVNDDIETTNLSLRHPG